ncbi:MAG: hypothetical protein SF187_12030 [Deltaproteobacteria bacterium]|nr:hypothetical protein [Deltaproteobacteria bacterium]
MKNFRRLSVLSALVAFFLNPGFGCGQSDDFEFHEEEMRAAALGKWRVTNDSIDVSIELFASRGSASASRRLGLVRSAHACGSREFLRSADACLERSVLTFDVRTIDGSTLNGMKAQGTGEFEIYGRSLTPGRISLSFSNGVEMSIYMVEKSGGSFTGTMGGTGVSGFPAIRVQRL